MSFFLVNKASEKLPAPQLFDAFICQRILLSFSVHYLLASSTVYLARSMASLNFKFAYRGLVLPADLCAIAGRSPCGSPQKHSKRIHVRTDFRARVLIWPHRVRCHSVQNIARFLAFFSRAFSPGGFLFGFRPNERKIGDGGCNRMRAVCELISRHLRRIIGHFVYAHYFRAISLKSQRTRTLASTNHRVPALIHACRYPWHCKPTIIKKLSRKMKEKNHQSVLN